MRIHGDKAVIAGCARLAVPRFAAARPMPLEFAVAQCKSTFVTHTSTFFILIFICHNHITSDILAEIFSLVVVVLAVDFGSSVIQPMIELPELRFTYFFGKIVKESDVPPLPNLVEQ